jgi:hypothetical protein
LAFACRQNHHLVADAVADARGHLVLQRKQVGHVTFEDVGPLLRTGLRVGELGMDPKPVAVGHHAALKNETHPQIATDLLHGHRLVAIRNGSAHRNDEGIADAGKIGRDAAREPVGNVRALRVTRLVDKRQHDNGKRSRIRGRGLRCDGGCEGLVNRTIRAPISEQPAQHRANGSHSHDGSLEAFRRVEQPEPARRGLPRLPLRRRRCFRFGDFAHWCAVAKLTGFVFNRASLANVAGA